MTTTSTEICENVLKAIKAYNIEHGIAPTESALIDHLLARQIELRDAYEDVHAKLGNKPMVIRALFDILLGASLHWNPAKMAKARQDRAALEAVNQRIATVAADLAGLLEKRRHLENTSGFISETSEHIVDHIDQAGSMNGWYQSRLAAPLKALAGQYDYKYWPPLDEILRALSDQAAQAQVVATDSMTEAATNGQNPSNKDFFWAIFSGLERMAPEYGGLLPPGFRLKDSTMASLGNCLLDLNGDELVGADYVKTVRTRFEKSRNV